MHFQPAPSFRTRTRSETSCAKEERKKEIMMKLLELTDSITGSLATVNFEHVILFNATKEGGTVLDFGASELKVKESYTEIKEKLVPWNT